MNWLGSCYHHGHGVHLDMNQAVEWYQTAADLGDANAMFNLGTCYEDGSGVQEDMDKASEWYQRAAELGDASAIDILFGSCCCAPAA